MLLARRRPDLAGAAAVIIMTADLAAANARYVLTVPQSLFESQPEVLKIIEAAERSKPTPGPYRIHRMPIWSPLGWLVDFIERPGFRDRRRGSTTRCSRSMESTMASSIPTPWALPSSMTTSGTSWDFTGQFATPTWPGRWA